MKAWPNSAHELLSNLKLALDQDWLLQPSFYEEQNLREFFGARERFGIIPPNPQRLGFSINSSSYVKEQKRFSSEQLHTMSYFDQTDGTIEGSTGVTSVGKKFGSIYLYLREASIPFSEVERIFGSSWKFNPPNYPPSPHRILLPITHPLGMKYMLFDLNTLSHTKHIRIETHENGALSHFQIQIQEK